VSGDEQAVREAAATLVAAFAEGRVDDYFAHFAPEATFVFHTADERLGSRAEYRALWDAWERDDGFRVLGCDSRAAEVQPLGPDGAVFVHDVDTRVATHEGEASLRERETIVFARRAGRWIAVHEHLSPRPAGAPEPRGDR
jgi:ketosteroid isomerase-like protein